MRPSRQLRPAHVARVSVPEAAPSELVPVAAVLGNRELQDAHPLSRLAHGAELLRAAGLQGVPSPGQVPLSAMRALMRASQAEREGLDTADAAATMRRSTGAPIPEAVRSRLEAAFGHDLSHVRVHTDGAAAEAAVDLHALAFTLGSEIFFGAGMFSPEHPDGLELLAHELCHVVQHDEHRLPGHSGQGMDVSRPTDATELEAVAMGREVAAEMWSDAEVFDSPSPAEPTGAKDSSASGLEQGAGTLARETSPDAKGGSGSKGVTGPKVGKFKPITQDDAAKGDAKLKVNQDGITAKVKAESKIGVGGTLPIHLVEIPLQVAGESLQLSATLELSVFAGLKGSLEAEIGMRWRDSAKSGGKGSLPHLDDFLEWLKSLLAKHALSTNPTALSEDEAKQIAQDKGDGPSNTIKKGKISGKGIIATGGGAGEQDDALKHVENKSALEKKKGVSGEVKVDAFAGVEASAKLAVALDWDRKDASSYDFDAALSNLVSMLKILPGPVSLLMEALEGLGGPTAVSDALGRILGPVLNFKAEKASLGEASAKLSARAGVGMGLDFKVGFAGGRLRWTLAAGATWGLGASFSTDWGLDVLNGARLALVMIDDPAMKPILEQYSFKNMTAKAIQLALDGWNMLMGWLGSDNKAREQVTKGIHELLPADARGAILKNLIGCHIQFVCDDDEKASTILLEFSQQNGDLGLVLNAAGRSKILQEIGEFEVPEYRARAWRAVAVEPTIQAAPGSD